MLARPGPIVLLLSVSLTAGCAVGPDYRSPEIAVPSRFLGQDSVVHREVQSDADLQAWWAGNLLQMRDEKVQAQTEAARAAISSFRALGGGWNARDVRSKSYSALP